MCRREDFPPYDLTVGQLLDAIGRDPETRDLPVRVAAAGDWPWTIAGAAIVSAVDPWPRCLLLVCDQQLEPEDHVDRVVDDVVGAP